jgi:FkbM family methyltransferase
VRIESLAKKDQLMPSRVRRLKPTILVTFPKRIVQLVARLLEAVLQLGAVNALVVFSYIIRRQSIACVDINGRAFNFSPIIDRGVMSHFYKKGYRIKGSPLLIFDVGANIGDETLRFRHFHPEALIVAIEPSRRNRELLQLNFGDDHKVVIFECALWKSVGVIDLVSGETAEAFTVLDRPGSGASRQPTSQVRATTVKGILQELGRESDAIDIFKIDVEGAEEAIFCEGDNSWLEKVNVIIMEMPDNDAAGAFQRIMSALFERGLRGKSHICGENFIFCRENSGFSLEEVIGLDRR